MRTYAYVRIYTYIFIIIIRTSEGSSYAEFRSFLGGNLLVHIYYLLY